MALFFSTVLFFCDLLSGHVLFFLKIGKHITESQAAAIIGQHFKMELHDKVNNALQLHKFLQENPGHSDMVIAGIEQKSQQSIQLSFSEAIDMKGNLKLLPFLCFLCLYCWLFSL